MADPGRTMVTAARQAFATGVRLGFGVDGRSLGTVSPLQVLAAGLPVGLSGCAVSADSSDGATWDGPIPGTGLGSREHQPHP